MHLNFKVGDTVRRTRGEWLGMRVGDVARITAFTPSGGVRLEGYATEDGVGAHDRTMLTLHAPESRQMLLSTDADERKATPITTGVLDYFPLALAEVAKCSKAGNDQHNPGKPLHWAKEKSTDHADCIARHLIDRGSRDTDGVRHSAKLAWRALALLQIELEKANAS